MSTATLELAVFSDVDGFHVIDNACPHAHGNLAGGECRDGVVTCPWHHWRFDVRTGRCVENAEVGVATYEVEIRAGWLWVRRAGA